MKWLRRVPLFVFHCVYLIKMVLESSREIQAEAERARGNKAYMAGKYIEACEYYSNCIALLPIKEAYNNRAQASSYSEILPNVKLVAGVCVKGGGAHLLGTSQTVFCQSIGNTTHLIGNCENSNTLWYGIPVLSFTGDIQFFLSLEIQR